MIKIDTVVQQLFYELSEKVDADRQIQEQGDRLNQLATLLGIDSKTLIQIEYTMFLTQMRTIEITCREAFLYSISFSN